MEAKEVGERIKFFREKRKMTQNALANQAGVSPTYIYQLERGEKSPTVEYLSHICWGLDISLTSFFADRNFEEPTETDKFAEAEVPAATDEAQSRIPEKIDGVKLTKREAEFLIILLNNYINEAQD